jgi:hypothetical protein
MDKFNFSNNSEVIDWLRKTKLIKPCRTCSICDRPMKWSAKPKNADGWVWRWGKCQKMVTICEDSFFVGIRLQLIEIVHLAWYWALQIRGCDVAREMGINEKTVVKYNRIFRQ